MKPLLLVMNPRAIGVCVEAIANLQIDKVWLKNFTEGQLVDVIEDVIDGCDHDVIGLVSDDCIPTQDTLDLVLSHYEPSRVYTGYCNIDTDSTLVNLSMQPLILQDEADIGCYTMPHRVDIEAHPSPLIRSWFAGFALTFMSREMWQRYPFHAIGHPGCQSDYSLCRRLQTDGVDIYAVRGAFMEHLKGSEAHTKNIPGGELWIGREPAEVVWDLRG